MALPVPQHVSLNHLYCTAIKDGMMVLGATQRYKEKFFTVVFYSVMPGTAGAHWYDAYVDNNNNRDIDGCIRDFNNRAVILCSPLHFLLIVGLVDLCMHYLVTHPAASWPVYSSYASVILSPQRVAAQHCIQFFPHPYHTTIFFISSIKKQ